MPKIIIVDDSKIVRVSLKQFLEDNNHEVIAEGENGEHAIDLFFKHNPDILFLDINMPVMSGRDALDEILFRDNSACILMVSALSQNEIIIDCLQRGAKGFIEKPLRFDDEAFVSEVKESISEALE